MKEKLVVLMPIVFGIIAGDYVGPQNGFRNGNGNGNAYGVPTGPVAPPQTQGGPYPPSGWKPAGRRFLLPGEGRDAQQPVDSGFGQTPPPQYGPVNTAPSGPSIDSQYGPSVDNIPPAPPNNQYIPGAGFGNGDSNGNGFSSGNGHNGNGHNGNGHNGNGHNGNGHGNGSSNGNGHGGGNGNGNGNGHNGGNGFGAIGNGHGNGNGAPGNGNGHNGGNGNGNKGGNGTNGSKGFVPAAFHGAFPGGVIYPFVQHSVPAVLAFRPSNGAGHGSIYPVYQVPTTPSQSGTDIIVSSLPTGHGAFPLASAYPSIHASLGISDLATIYPSVQVASAHKAVGSHSALTDSGTVLVGNEFGQYYTFLTNHHSQKSHMLGIQNGLTNLQLRYPSEHAAYSNAGVPLGVF